MASTRKLERELRKIYSEAQRDLTKKWRDYFERGEKRLAKKEEALQAAKASGDKEKIASVEEDLRTSKENYTFGNTYYRNMVEETTIQLANTNQTALSYVNGQLPEYYARTFNSEMVYEAKQLGIRYDLVDAHTVRRRVLEGDIKLPYKDLDKIKDQRWNTKYINSQVTQGIIQGEPMDKIADRLFPEIMSKTDVTGLSDAELAEVIRRNEQAAIRNARTLVNGAENAGRLDRYRELEKQGTVLKKVWTATGDDRTRDLHLEMDGQKVDINEPFEDADGNELMFPCDPDGAPETVYNCRCRMHSEIVGFINKKTGEIEKVKESPPRNTKHEEAIAEQKEIRKENKRKNA